jgi:hypothetical protein
MDELRDRFATLDRVPVPDVWNDVERRLEAFERRTRGGIVAGKPAWRGAPTEERPLRSGVPFGRAGIVLLAAALIVGLLVVGAVAVGSRLTRLPSVLPTPQTGSPSPSAPSPTQSPSVALTEMFTSDRLGYSSRYPRGWDVSPMTEPWSADGLPGLGAFDVFSGPDSRFIVTSRRLAAGEAPDAWAAGLEPADGMYEPPSCHLLPPGRVEVAIGDDTGFIIDRGCSALGPFSGWSRAIATVDGRAYVFQIDGDTTLFESFLGGITLDPYAAVDQPN